MKERLVVWAMKSGTSVTYDGSSPEIPRKILVLWDSRYTTDACFGRLRARHVLRAVLSVLREATKLSIAALSQLIPERLIARAIPLPNICSAATVIFWL